MDVPPAAATPLQLETSLWLYQLNKQSVNQRTISFSNMKNSLTAFWDTKPNVSAVSALNVLTNAKCNIIKQCRSFLVTKGMEMWFWWIIWRCWFWWIILFHKYELYKSPIIRTDAADNLAVCTHSKQFPSLRGIIT